MKFFGSFSARAVTIALLGIILSLLSPFGASGEAQAAVRSCSAQTPVAQMPTVRYGDTGSCVRVAQQSLINKGFSVGPAGVDGSYGRGTLAGTTGFQRANGLVDDGIIGPKTWAKLMNGGPPAPPRGGTYNRGRGPNYTNKVILTYDDCPKSLSILESTVNAAKQYGVAIVLAPTGDCITRFKSRYGVDITALARSRGQYVINHSISHPDLRTLSYSGVIRQLGAPGVVTNYGRPPYGALNQNVLNAYTAVGMLPWTWTKDTADWRGKSNQQVVSYVVANARPGDTVLMHMQWNGFSPNSLRDIKAGLARRGISLCKVYPGTAPVRLPSSMPC